MGMTFASGPLGSGTIPKKLITRRTRRSAGEMVNKTSAQILRPKNPNRDDFILFHISQPGRARPRRSIPLQPRGRLTPDVYRPMCVAWHNRCDECRPKMVAGKRVALFEISGITVRVDLSWLLIAGLITWSLAEGLFPQRFANLSGAWHWAMAIAGALGLFVSIVLHELAHGVAALGLGIPMHGITVFLFGGVAEMAEEPKTAKAELWMAAAGPVASILLAILFLPLALDAQIAAQYAPLSGIAEYLTVMNLLLAAFNLLPAFPLDGGRVMRALIWWATGDLHRATRIAAGAGRLFGTAFIALGLYELATLELIAGGWWMMIGFFLRSAAKSAVEQAGDVLLPETWQKSTNAPLVHPPLSPSRHTQPNLAS